MKWIHATAAILALVLPSYAWPAPLEGLLGTSMPAQTGSAETPFNSPAFTGTVADASSARTAARFQSVLDNLAPDVPSANRGANEERVYRSASPSVVLIVTDDALGSGVVVGPSGLIVTNLHVVGKANSVGVVFKPAIEGATISKANVLVARVIRRDEVADLALIQVAEPPSGVPVLKVGSSADVEVGSDVHAIGHPTGEAWTYTRGIVSQIRRNYSWSNEDKVPHNADVIQTQTPINPGNSGGPLLNDSLEVVGINAFKSAGEGLNFAISGEDVQALLARTQDRMEAPPVRESSAGAACQWKVLNHWRSTDPLGTYQAIDTACDGKVGFVLFTPDDTTQPRFLLFDSKGTGKFDTMFVDERRDGAIEYAFYDTVGDGKFHVKGYFRPGESEPYRYEPISN